MQTTCDAAVTSAVATERRNTEPRLAAREAEAAAAVQRGAGVADGGVDRDPGGRGRGHPGRPADTLSRQPRMYTALRPRLLSVAGAGVFALGWPR